MQLSRTLCSLLLAGVTVVSCAAAYGQAFPSRPIRIATSEIGGINDLASRMIAQGLAGSIGQPVIVDNRGIIAIDIVAKATPDGHTLLCFANNFWVLPFLQDNYPYDPIRDFSPITLVVTAPNILAVNPAVAATSVKELVALAKAKPGVLNYGAGATGGAPHLSAELFKAMAGVNIVRVNYKGTAQALNGVIGGEAADDIRHAGFRGSAGESRQAEGAGGHQRQALRTRSGPAHAVGIGITRLRSKRDTRRLCARAHSGCDRQQTEPGDRARTQPAGSEGALPQRRL